MYAVLGYDRSYTNEMMGENMNTIATEIKTEWDVRCAGWYMCGSNTTDIVVIDSYDGGEMHICSRCHKYEYKEAKVIRYRVTPKPYGARFCGDLFNNVGRWANIRGDKESGHRSWQVKRAMRDSEGKRFYLMQNYDTKQWRVVPSDMLGNLY